MLDEFSATASARIFAPAEVVWDALLNPDAIRQFMFGTHVISDFHEGHPIKWQGEWQGRRYEDKGTILQLKPLRLLRYTHFSPLEGKPDVPGELPHGHHQAQRRGAVHAHRADSRQQRVERSAGSLREELELDAGLAQEVGGGVIAHLIAPSVKTWEYSLGAKRGAAARA